MAKRFFGTTAANPVRSVYVKPLQFSHRRADPACMDTHQESAGFKAHWTDETPPLSEGARLFFGLLLVPVGLLLMAFGLPMVLMHLLLLPMALAMGEGTGVFGWALLALAVGTAASRAGMFQLRRRDHQGEGG